MSLTVEGFIRYSMMENVGNIHEPSHRPYHLSNYQHRHRSQCFPFILQNEEKEKKTIAKSIR